MISRVPDSSAFAPILKVSIWLALATGLGVVTHACSDDSSSPTMTTTSGPGGAGNAGASVGAAGTGGSGGASSSSTGTAGTAGTAGTSGNGGSGGSASTGIAGAGGTGGSSMAGSSGAGGSTGGSGGSASDAGPDMGAGCDTSPGYALQFRGTGDDRVHADITKLPINNESRTIELWAYFDGTDLSWHSEHGLFEYGMKGGCHEFGLNSVDWPNGGQAMIHPYGNCSEIDNFFNMPAGTMKTGWVHFSFGYDNQGKQFHFTIDGSEMITGRMHPIGNWPADNMFSTMKSPLRIGTTDDFQGPPGWQGKIDELRVWNVYRTAAEIKANMKVMLKGNEPGLVAYYKFDEGKGQSSADATGDAANAANFVGADKATWPMWVKSDMPGPFICAP